MSSQAAAHRSGEQIAPTAPGHILVAVRDDEDSNDVITAAGFIADHVKWDARIVSVLEPVAPYVGLGAAAPPSPEGILPPESEAPSIEMRRASVRARAAMCGSVQQSWPVDVIVGPAASSILAAAHRTAASLVVMGLGHNRVSDRLVGGATTARVFRQLGRPVIGIRGRWTCLARRVVMATDFSPASIAAAKHAAILIAPDAVVHLVHVWIPPGSPPESLARPKLAEERVERAHWERLIMVRRELALPPQAHVDSHVLDGDPAEQLLLFAAKVQADLVVIGSHGRPFVSRLVLGSVASEIARRCTTSVFFAPPPSSLELEELERHVSGLFTSRRPSEWPSQLTAFNERNLGRPALLEVYEPGTEPQIQEIGLHFLGATYEPSTDVLTLSLGDGTRNAHLTKVIRRPVQVATETYGHHKDETLRIACEHGQVLLTFPHA